MTQIDISWEHGHVLWGLVELQNGVKHIFDSLSYPFQLCEYVFSS